MDGLTSSGLGRVLRCPLGAPSRTVQRHAFGQTLFKGMTEASPSQIALTDISCTEVITFESFTRKACLIARHLLCLGCRKGDVLAIFAPNSIQWMLMSCAAFRIGAVPAGILRLHTANEVHQQLLVSGAKFLFTSSSHVTKAVEASSDTDVLAVIVDGNYPNCVPFGSLLSASSHLPRLPEFEELELGPQDVAIVMFSSGTTGRQKAVMLSHLNLQAQFVISSDEKVRKVRHNQIIFAPCSHLAGGVMTLYALALGYTTHLMTDFRLDSYLKLLSYIKNESIAVIPSVAIALAKAAEVSNYDLKFLKEIICGTAPLSAQTEHLLLSRIPGVIVRQGYGLTETTALCTIIPRHLQAGFARTKSGSIGVPLFNVQIKIINPDTGAILGPRQNGELLIKSPLVMKGYKDCREGSNSEVIDNDGWLHSGDMGYYDEDGYLWIVDRIKDMIKYDSYQVSPSELESVLLSHPEVADVAVFALPDPTSCNELPAAWVVRKPAGRVTEVELDLHVSGILASYKRLRGGITFVENIPRFGSGKILRNKIREAAICNSRELIENLNA